MIRSIFLRPLLAILFLGSLSCEAWGRQDLRDMLTRKLDYDEVIRQSADQLAKGSGDKKELLALQAYAFYLKGKLLLTAYRSNLELTRLYYGCKSSLAGKGEYIVFSGALISAAKSQSTISLTLLPMRS